MGVLRVIGGVFRFLLGLAFLAMLVLKLTLPSPAEMARKRNQEWQRTRQEFQQREQRRLQQEEDRVVREATRRGLDALRGVK